MPRDDGETWDRRRHVRVRPSADYDIQAAVCEGTVFTTVQIVDLSLGGIGLLLEPPIDSVAMGGSFELKISTPESSPVRARVVVRHQARGVCGAQFETLSEKASLAIGRAVSELLERGHQA